MDIVIGWFLSYERSLLWVIRFRCRTECGCIVLCTLSALTLYGSVKGRSWTNDGLRLNRPIGLFLGWARIVIGVAIGTAHVSGEKTIAREGEGANDQDTDQKDHRGNKDRYNFCHGGCADHCATRGTGMTNDRH